MKRLLALIAVFAALFALSAAPALASSPPLDPTVASVAAALKVTPIFVDPVTQTTGPLTVDPVRLKPVVPAGAHLAVVRASIVPAGADPTEVPALLSSAIGQGGTFVVLIGRQLYGASTTVPGQLADDLAAAQAALPKTGDATPALIALERSLDGPGNLQDAQSPVRAGGPIGVPLLVVIVLVLVAGAFVLWWYLRRKPAVARARRPAPLRDLVEIDYEGNIIRRTPASQREQ